MHTLIHKRTHTRALTNNLHTHTHTYTHTHQVLPHFQQEPSKLTKSPVPLSAKFPAKDYITCSAHWFAATAEVLIWMIWWAVAWWRHCDVVRSKHYDVVQSKHYDVQSKHYDVQSKHWSHDLISFGGPDVLQWSVLLKAMIWRMVYSQRQWLDELRSRVLAGWSDEL